MSLLFDVSQLPNYVDQISNKLIRKVYLQPKTLKTIATQVGIKNSRTINILGSTGMVLQADACSWNSSGSNNVTQRTLTVAPWAIMEGICVKDFNTDYLNYSLKAGSADQELPFTEEYLSLKAAQQAEKMEILAWQGNTSASGSLTNGLEYLIQNAVSISGSVRVDSGSAFTQSSSIQIVGDVYGAIPTQLLGDPTLTVFMGYDTLRSYTRQIASLNLYNYPGLFDMDSATVLGTTLKITPVHGLDNSGNHIYAGRAGQQGDFIAGFDLQDDELTLFYAQEARQLRYLQNGKIGFQIGIASQIVGYWG
jgi:hypothetical protein